MKPFALHPAPWKYESDYLTGSNGEGLDAILDANGEVVASTYGDARMLWAFYTTLTNEQIEQLGNDKPKSPKSFRESPPDAGVKFMFVNPDHYCVKDGEIYFRDEGYPVLVYKWGASPSCFYHIDDFGETTQWRELTSREKAINNVN